MKVKSCSALRLASVLGQLYFDLTGVIRLFAGQGLSRFGATSEKPEFLAVAAAASTMSTLCFFKRCSLGTAEMTIASVAFRFRTPSIAAPVLRALKSEDRAQTALELACLRSDADGCACYSKLFGHSSE